MRSSYSQLQVIPVPPMSAVFGRSSFSVKVAEKDIPKPKELLSAVPTENVPRGAE